MTRLKPSPNSNRQVIALIGVLLFASLLAAPAITSQLGRVFRGILTEQTSYAQSLTFTNPTSFSYDVSQISIDNRGATLNSPNSQSDLVLLDPIELPADSTIASFAETASAPAGTFVRYQLTTDFQNWYYFDGKDWKIAAPDCGTDCSNTAAEITDHIGSLPLKSNSLQVKVFLGSTRGAIPILNSLNLQLTGERPLLSSQQEAYLSQLSLAEAHGGCPLEKIEGRTIITFDDVLRADGDESQASTNSEDLSLVAGNYKVTLVSKDVSPGPDDGELEEQWYVVFKDANGNEVVSSNAIRGMNNSENQIAEVVNQSLEISQDISSIVGFHAAYPNQGPQKFKALCASFDRIGDDDHEWDKSSVEVEGICEAPNAVFTITNTGEEMDDTSEYRIYRNDELEDSVAYQLTNGETLTVVVAANGDSIRLEADQRPNHPGKSHPQATVENCSGPPPQGCVPQNFDYIGSNHGTILAEQYASQGIHLSAIANAGRPNALIVFDSNQTDTPDPDLEVGIGNLAIIPENLNDGNHNGLVDIPNDSAAGGTQIYRFDHDRVVNSFKFVDKDGGQSGVATAYDADNNVIATVNIPNAGDGSVQTVSMGGIGGVRKLEITYGDSGGVTDLDLDCGSGQENHPPVAEDDSAMTPMNTSVDIDILANDSDPDGDLDPSSVTIITNPSNGTITNIDSNTGVTTYSPNPGFYGTDTFVYQVCDLSGSGDDDDSDGDGKKNYEDDDDDNDGKHDKDDDDDDGDGIPDEDDHGDQSGLCDTATVTILVKAPPIAQDDTETTPYETPIDIDILANDSDPDSPPRNGIDPATVTITNNPANGTIISVNSVNGVVTYQPNSGFTGVDYFDYQVCDGDGLCDTATVAVSVDTPLLEPPVATDDFETTDQNTPVAIDILVNDYDPDGFLVPSTVNISVNPINGTITNINTSTGEVTYEPNTGYSGLDSFDYEICDNDGLCDTATVTIEIIPPPLIPPIANDDSETTPYETPIDIDILLNDYDPDGFLVPSTVFILTNPLNGVITNVNLTNGVTTYSPNAGFTGLDSFIYQVCDNDGLCDSATVTIGVEPPELIPPVALDDAETTDQDIPVTIDVLANDSDVDGVLVPGTVLVLLDPTNGTITGINSLTGEIEYAPDPGYTGIDQFDYQVCDNDGLCDNATVTITILPGVTVVAHKIVCSDEADLPNWGDHGPDVTAQTAIDFISAHQNCQLTSDWNFQWGPEGVSNPGDNTGAAANPWTTFGSTNPLGVTQVTIPASQVGNRIWIREVWNDSYLGFTGVGVTENVSAEIYCHQDVLNYDNFDFINNIKLGETYYCVAFNVAEIQPVPPVAQDDAKTTDEDTPVDIDILLNDYDPDGVLVPNTISIITNPTNGTITNVNTTTGVVTYSPNSGYTGIDTFVYEVCDNDGLCDTATVTITIQPVIVLLPPVANDDFETTDPNTPVDIDILINDSDADGFLVPSTVTITGFPTNGVITNIDSGTGMVTYSPNNGFFGIDTFTYIVCDNDGLCDDALVTITVLEPEPEPPIALDDGATTDQGVPVEIDILNNDSDPDGFLVPSTITIIDPPDNGDVTDINLTTGINTYTPDPGFSGIDSYIYRVCDNDGLCDTATVTIAIDALAPPVANDDNSTTPLNTPVTVSVLDNDFDVDGSLVPSTTVITSPPTNGAITAIDPLTGAITYTPNTSFTGTDTFDYQICDNDGLCDTATVTITISTGPPPPPPPPLVVPAAAPITLVATPVVAATPLPAPGTLIFGGNEFVLSAQGSPLSTNGVIQATVNEPQTFYLEAVGATSATLTNLDTADVYPMTFDPDLKLWAVTFIFTEKGQYRLEGQVSGPTGSYTREINTVVVSDRSSVTDITTGAPIDGQITIFEQDIATGNFEVWNGGATAQINPFPFSGDFTLVLPTGEFYLQIDAPGYNTVTSLIENVTEQSFVTANVKLSPTGSLTEQLQSLFRTDDTSNNFPLEITPVPTDFSLLTKGNQVPDILVRTSDRAEFSLFSDLDPNLPTVIMVYSGWNTLAQEQLQIFAQVAEKLGDNVQLIPISTMDPDNHDLLYLSRGEYGLELYKPSDAFYDDYSISSLPQFFILDSNQTLIETLLGPQAEISLENQILEALNL